MELLFVNACPRGKDSRTLALAEHLLRHLQQKLPELIITRHDLPTMRLQPVNARRLKRKEALCDQRNWDDPLTAIGADFQRANAVIIAAPYWDLSFPSILKTWVENIWVRNLTFFYRDDKPVGLAKGKAAVYVTTAGSYTAKHDWGTLYIEDVMKTLGIPAFRAVKAEALDLLSSDPETILTIARTEAESAADWLRKRLTEE
ncbi:MAG: NAD(P)H-dependent oxidoreductase [Clostridia bacterium]|nr:NAD(P)H-dependent oxidoreductase [Clostridia bacterium]